MKEGRGTLKELTALWRKLDPRGKWELVEMAYGICQIQNAFPECRRDMPSHEETMKLRKELKQRENDVNRLETAGFIENSR